MILSALVAMQIAAPPRAALIVRDADHSVSIPLIASAGGPRIRPDEISKIIPVVVRRQDAVHYVLTVGETSFELDLDVPAVRIGSDVRQMAIPPIVRDGHLLVPLQLVSDIIPTVVPNTRWDAESNQLVIFSSGARRSAAQPLVAESPVKSESSSSIRYPRDPGIRPAGKRSRHVVIVDAGHGGVDNGMSGPLNGGPRIFEKDITLAVAKRLGASLKERGVDVVYTRTTDTLIALDDRGRVANRAAGDLFISIHVNAANPNWKDPGGARGFETYFLSEARTEDSRRVEQMENAAVRYEADTKTVDKDDPLSFILSDMKQNEHLRESSELAATIQQRLAGMHPGPSRGVKQAGFRVLVTAYMPAVLVEIGFGTNAREAQYISSPDKQDALADAIATAAMEYLQRFDRRVAGPAQ